MRKTRYLVPSLLVVFAAAALALDLTPIMATAQQTAVHSAISPRHPGVIAGRAYRAPRPATPVARASVPMPTVRPGTPSRPAWPAYRVRVASAVRVPRAVGPVSRVVERHSFRAIFDAPHRFIGPFFFSAPFPRSSGLAGSVSQFGGLPLGFGLWPACDSAATPGRFWTVGPCFGIGSYSAELAPSATPPVPYTPPLILFSPPPSGPAAAQPPSAPGPSPTMTLYLADGRTIAATDWWVSLGRLQYITDSGQTGAVDVLQLDLDRTNKENQKRGLDFRLKFTAPSDAYPPSIRP
ncbi:MAG: hypothetical protein ACRD3B_14345 [Candidatus Sulfotelmatobacter sp.]